MRKYYLGYLLFLLPALIVSLFFKNAATLSIILQWFFAFFMIIGFGVNTSAAAYYYPNAAMSFILGYSGINLLIIAVFYTSGDGTALYRVLRDYGGALSYVPLDIMLKALIEFNVQHEVVVTLVIVASCLIGYIVGLVRRRVSPNPYSPRIG